MSFFSSGFTRMGVFNNLSTLFCLFLVLYYPCETALVEHMAQPGKLEFIYNINILKTINAATGICVKPARQLCSVQYKLLPGFLQRMKIFGYGTICYPE